MPWRPTYPGEVPTLGFEVLEWMQWALAAPDRSAYEPFVPTREQAQFLINFYALDPRTGRRRFRRAVYSRPKGSGKSPFLGAIMLAEALAPVVPAGWDAGGRPVCQPWSDLRTPWVQVMAVSEDQTKNAWTPILEMLRNGPACEIYPGLEPLDTFINLPRGRMEAVTASSTSREGNRPVACLLDQTESWIPSNGGVRLAATARRNLGKTNGVSVEAPNAFRPGMESVAEASADFSALIESGKAKDDGLLYDHREAPGGTKLDDRESLMAGLRYAYGDAHWVDLDRIVAEIWDPATDPQDARQYYLNQVTHASDSWMTQPDWAACIGYEDPEAEVKVVKKLRDDDVVTLGFDGSQKDDSTALVACRVADGHLELLGCWERPEKAADWQVDTALVDAAVRRAFDRFSVIGFYADPPLWQSYIDMWTQEFAPSTNTAVRKKVRSSIKVKAAANRPFEWWTNRASAAEAALERFHTGVRGKELSHTGDSVLTTHVLNARRKMSGRYLVIGKATPKSSRKIDAAMAAVLAYEARCDAVAQGVGAQKRRRGGAIFQRVQ